MQVIDALDLIASCIAHYRRGQFLFIEHQPDLINTQPDQQATLGCVLHVNANASFGCGRRPQLLAVSVINIIKIFTMCVAYRVF